MVDSKGRDVELPKEVAEALNLDVSKAAKKAGFVEDAGVGGLATPEEPEATLPVGDKPVGLGAGRRGNTSSFGSFVGGDNTTGVLVANSVANASASAPAGVDDDFDRLAAVDTSAAVAASNAAAGEPPLSNNSTAAAAAAAATRAARA